MKIKKIAARALAVLLIFVAVVLVVRAVLNYTTGKKLERYLAASKASGTLLRMKDMVPSCPDADNAARLWKAAEALFQAGPNGTMLAGKAIDDLYQGRVPDEPARRDLTAMIDANRRPIDLMLEAGERPCFQYSDWKQPAYDAAMPKAIAMIALTRLAAIEAVFRAEKGQSGPALDECLRAMQFNRRTLDEAYLVRGLVALADMKIVLISAMHIAEEVKTAPHVLASWITELDPTAWRLRFLRSFAGERAFMLEAGLDAMEGKRDLFDSLGVKGSLPRLYYWLMRPAMKSEIVWMQRYFEDVQTVGRQPFYRQSDFLRQTHERAKRRPWYFLLSGMLLPEFNSVFMKEATLEAMMNVTRAGIACKLFRQKNGKNPGALADLVPEYLKDVPLDPFTGKPLIYRLENGELLIYSVGSNLKDDGGRMSKITQLVMPKDDDWTWRETIK